MKRTFLQGNTVARVTCFLPSGWRHEGFGGACCEAFFAIARKVKFRTSGPGIWPTGIGAAAAMEADHVRS